MKTLTVWTLSVIILAVESQAQNNNVGFSWSSCGSSSDPIKMQVLEVTPDPLHFPTTINVKFDVKVAKNISAPVKAEVKIKKKTFFGWIEIPCDNNVGSCTYDDLCAMSPYTDQCPSTFTKNNLPCKCPIPQGRYTAKNLQKYVDPGLPKWLEKGRYSGTATLSSNGEQLQCTKFGFSIN